MNRFDYVEYDQRAQDIQAVFKKRFMELENRVEAELDCGRSKALALTKLEEAYMWVGKAIRNDQIARNRETNLQEQRVNS